MTRIHALEERVRTQGSTPPPTQQSPVALQAAVPVISPPLQTPQVQPPIQLAQVQPQAPPVALAASAPPPPAPAAPIVSPGIANAAEERLKQLDADIKKREGDKQALDNLVAQLMGVIKNIVGGLGGSALPGATGALPVQQQPLTPGAIPNPTGPPQSQEAAAGVPPTSQQSVAPGGPTNLAIQNQPPLKPQASQRPTNPNSTLLLGNQPPGQQLPSSQMNLSPASNPQATSNNPSSNIQRAR